MDCGKTGEPVEVAVFGEQGTDAGLATERDNLRIENQIPDRVGVLRGAGRSGQK